MAQRPVQGSHREAPVVIRASAPGRAGIVGNPTDGYGGSVISCSLAERAAVTLTPAARFEAAVAGRETAFLTRDDWRLQGDYFDFIRAAVQFLGGQDLRVRVEATTNIPVQAGLAGSTALLASLVAVLLEWHALHDGLRLDAGAESARLLVSPERPPSPGPRHSTLDMHRHLFAETIRTIELNFLRIQCGYQDQYMTTFGGLNYLDFRDKEFYRPLDEEVYATVEPLADLTPVLPFVVVHTGVKRTSGVVLKPIRERWMEGDAEVVRGYRRIGTLCRRAKRALIEGDWDALAAAMNENHRIQQALGASGPENDRLIEVARRGGALAAKLAGAGGGGTILALTLEPDRTVAALTAAGAAQVLTLKPSPGVTIEHCHS
jgi:galactokinase/mevalonate kinase-like predicted kinase